jgi:hypothetical protein
MRFKTEQAMQILQRTPAVLRAMLGGGLDEAWIRNNYGPDTFSPFDVVGHLIHGERTDWLPRIRHILRHGESIPFEPFDRYAMYDANRGKSIGQLLDEFGLLRDENLRELRALDLNESQFELKGLHPALGEVTVRQLIATWVAHDLNHIHQIAKCMAWQYRDEVGPWLAYLGALK